MSYSRIESALDTLGLNLKEQYLLNFTRNEVDDETIQGCMKNSDEFILVMSLCSTIPVLGHRMKFIRAFRALGELEGVQDRSSEDSNVTVKVEEGNELSHVNKDCLQVKREEETVIEFNKETKAFLVKMKEFYMFPMKRAVKQVMEDIIGEEELRKIKGDLRRDTISKLKEESKKLKPSPRMVEAMVKDVQEFIQAEFKGTLLLLKIKSEEDDLAVKTALLDSRKFYEEEMEKRLKAKDWFEEEELEGLHKELRNAAIEKSKKEVDLTPGQENKLLKVMDAFYKKFQDRNYLRMPRDSYAVGIDLGTTYSCVAVCIKGKIHVIPCDGKKTIPSFVAFNDDRSVSVGEPAKEQAFRRPESTIFDVKRLIGRKFKHPIVQEDMKLWPFQVIGEDDQPKIKIPKSEKSYRPEEVSARVLIQLKKMAEEFLNRKVTNAVVTVPAYFNDSQRQATKDAAKIAGLNVIIINEPTAAAIAYYYESHLVNDLKRNVLIFDLGGGTFDVAVLEMKAGNIEVKGIGGDTHLGGEDFDNEMVMHVIKTVKRKEGIDLSRGRESSNSKEKRKAAERLRRIRSVCEIQKRHLSTAQSSMITLDRIDEAYDLYEPFSREVFESLNLDKFQRCITVMGKVICDAGLQKSEIDDIVLIGGSTKIPKIRELVVKYFEGKALNSQINPDEAVAYGAAVHAALEFGKSDEVPGESPVSWSDVTPMSLGIKLYNGDFSCILPRNTPTPCARTIGGYRTSVDWVTEQNFSVYEGEEPMADDNNFLGRFCLKGVPSARRGNEKFRVTVEVDREGILRTTAVSESTGRSKDIRIEAYKGRMSGNEIESAKAMTGSSRW